MDLIAIYIIQANKVSNKALLFDNDYSLSLIESKGVLKINIGKKGVESRKFYHIKNRLSIVTLVGANGMGKTTVMECLSSSTKHQYVVFYNHKGELLIEGHVDGLHDYEIQINNTTTKGVPMKNIFSLIYSFDRESLGLYDFHSGNRNSIFYSNLLKWDNKSLFKTDGYYLSKSQSLSFDNQYEQMIYISNNLSKINKLLPKVELKSFRINFKEADISWERGKIISDSRLEEFKGDMEVLFERINLPEMMYYHFKKSENEFSIIKYIYNQVIKGFMSTHFPDKADENGIYKKIMEMSEEDCTPEKVVEELINYAHNNYTIEYRYEDLQKALLIINDTTSNSDYIWNQNGASLEIRYASDFVQGFKVELEKETEKFKKYREEQVQSYLEKEHILISEIMINKAIFNDLFSIDFYEASSGEERLIDLLINLVKTTEHDLFTDNSNHSYILLDEPDIYFNPELNRRLVSELVDLYKHTTKKYTIIMSTHSPYTLSDIPSSNILNLNSKEMLICTGEVKQTFGKNISDISIESFILESNQGEFFINIVREILRKERMTKEEFIDYNYYVEQVGDEFLKDALRKKMGMVVVDDR